MLLVGDIMQEVPSLVHQFMEQNILQPILAELSKRIPIDADMIPNVVYFVNMYCLVDKGRELEQQHNIIDKVLHCFTDKSYVEVLSSSKGQLKGKCIDSLALE